MSPQSGQQVGPGKPDRGNLTIPAGPVGRRFWNDQVSLHLGRLHRGWSRSAVGVLGKPLILGMEERCLQVPDSPKLSPWSWHGSFFFMPNSSTTIGPGMPQCPGFSHFISLVHWLSIAAEPLFRLCAEPWVMRLPQMVGQRPQGPHRAHLKTHLHMPHHFFAWEEQALGNQEIY